MEQTNKICIKGKKVITTLNCLRDIVEKSKGKTGVELVHINICKLKSKGLYGIYFDDSFGVGA